MSLLKDAAADVKPQTNGTWIVIVANCALALFGVLQGVDWVTLIGSANAGWVVALLAAANAAAHYYTGPNVNLSSR